MSDRLTQAFEKVEEALQLAPEERAGYLDAACLEPSLRNYVEALLLSHMQAGRFLEEPALASCAGALSEDDKEAWVGEAHRPLSAGRGAALRRP